MPTDDDFRWALGNRKHQTIWRCSDAVCILYPAPLIVRIGIGRKFPLIISTVFLFVRANFGYVPGLIISLDNS